MSVQSEDLQTLLNAIQVAQKRGAFNLEEAHTIFKVVKKLSEQLKGEPTPDIVDNPPGSSASPPQSEQ